MDNVKEIILYGYKLLFKDDIADRINEEFEVLLVGISLTGYSISKDFIEHYDGDFLEFSFNFNGKGERKHWCRLLFMQNKRTNVIKQINFYCHEKYGDVSFQMILKELDSSGKYDIDDKIDIFFKTISSLI